jgi:hypothetical protein
MVKIMKTKIKTLLFVVLVLSIIIFSSSYVSAEEVKYDPEILEEFEKTEWVPIIIKLYSEDMTKVDKVLTTLTEKEFELEGKFPNGRGFHGSITKEGFDKLIKNPDVKMIYLERISHVTDGDDIEEIELGIIEEEDKTFLWSLIIPIIIIFIIILYLVISNKKEKPKKRR